MRDYEPRKDPRDARLIRVLGLGLVVKVRSKRLNVNVPSEGANKSAHAITGTKAYSHVKHAEGQMVGALRRSRRGNILFSVPVNMKGDREVPQVQTDCENALYILPIKHTGRWCSRSAQ